MVETKKDIRDLRGPFNALIVRAMRRDGIKEITKWADHHDIGRTTLYALLRGRESKSGSWIKPSLETMVKLAEALGRPLHELIYIIEPDAPGANLIEGEKYVEAPEFPVQRLPVQVAGWAGGGPDQNVSLVDDEQYIYIEESFARGRDLLAFKVIGDSMAAGGKPIHWGDTVIIDRNAQPHNTDAVIARLDNDGYVCKVFKDDKFGRSLQSRNIDHTNGTPNFITPDQVAEIVGRVVRIIHDDTNPA